LIILDTNVLSAVMRSETDPVVVAWLDRQPPESLWTTAITVFEIEMGIRLLTEGRRRTILEHAFRRALTDDLDGRVLPFETDAALAAAKLAADRQRLGRVVDFRDTQIAGIAIARRASIATRNTRHFSGLPVEIIDPWDD
jgi:predicted nucleic acid-binding protein